MNTFLTPDLWWLLCVVIAAVCRLSSVVISRRHERGLRARGAQEFGETNSRWLAIAHTLFYAAAAIEGLWRGAAPTPISMAGAALWGLSMLALVLVIKELGPLWTIKVLVLRGQPLKTGSLYRLCRHPNYFLNLLPELVGLALALNAWMVLAVGFVPYVLVLRRRIAIEEAALVSAGPQPR